MSNARRLNSQLNITLATTSATTACIIREMDSVLPNVGWASWIVSIVVASLTSAVAGWYVWFHTSKVTTSVNEIPGPKPLPLIGNTSELTGGFEALLDVLAEKWVNAHGRLYRMYIGLRPHIIISSHESLEPLLSSGKFTERGVFYDLMRPWLGESLLTITGSKWKMRRRYITPAFHFKVLDDFLETFNEQSHALCHKLQNLSREQSCQIDVYPMMSACALDIISESAMGCKFNTQVAHREYTEAANRIVQIVLERFSRPWLQNKWIFSLTQLGREHRRCLKTLHSFTDYGIRHRRIMFQETYRESKLFDMGAKTRRSFLDLILEAVEAGAPLTDGDIRDEVEIFMFKGHDTIASVTSWFLYCMACYPDQQETVRKELDAIFDYERYCTQEDTRRMKHLKLCIKESMRMFPPHPFFLRETTKPVKLDGHDIPAGCDLLILIYALHRNPQIFPDPEVFRPERFNRENCSERPPLAYIPFSAGPRNCVGYKFAMLELKTILSTILRKFEFKLPLEAERPKPTCQIMLKPVNGINLIVCARKKSVSLT